MTSPYRVVVVCTGNICRSPIAEAVLERAFAQAGLVVDVSSAGTGSWHIGDDADPRALKVLALAGYDMQHEARQFDPAWFVDVDSRADLVLALDSSHRRDLQVLASKHGVDSDHVLLLRSFDPDAVDVDVPDPYYGADSEFDDVLAMIEAAAPGIVEFVREQTAG